jgi:biotin-(acetyl-CoA carboxylase) ligase
MKLLLYSQAAALAVCSVLDFMGCRAKVKWPNDVVVDGKKISGILVEEATHDTTSWAIVGVGLNVNMNEKLLQEIDQPATSISQCLQKNVLLSTVQEQMILELKKSFIFAKHHPLDCHARWVESCSWMIGSSTYHAEGVIDGFLDDGGLLVKKSSGQILKVYSV